MVGSLDQIQARKQKDMQCNTFATSGTKEECPRKAVVKDRWQLTGKFGLRFRCLKRSQRIGRCLLKGTCLAEGYGRRNHAQPHATIEPPKLKPSAETFHPSQADMEGTPTAGTPITYAT